MGFGTIMRVRVDPFQVELAPMEESDMGEFIGNGQGGGLQQYSISHLLARHTAPVLADEKEWYESIRTSDADILWGIWLVKRGARTLIGNTGLHSMDKMSYAGFIRQAVSGSLIFRPEYWGKGIGTATHKARTWYAFRHLGLHQIQTEVLQSNVGSRKALERSGYAFHSTKRNEAYVDGELVHMDTLVCVNPLPLFWDQWWHGEVPPEDALSARETVLSVLDWADQNVELA